MCIFKKHKPSLDPLELKKAQEIFFRCNGSYSLMIRDGVFKEYKKFKIPQDTEKKWMDMLIFSKKEQVISEKHHAKKTLMINELMNYGIREEEILSLVVDILSEGIDSFSRILLCESIKSLGKNGKVHKIGDIISEQKEILLTNPIVIDDFYRELYYMRGYDFSESNIVRRISNL